MTELNRARWAAGCRWLLAGWLLAGCAGQRRRRPGKGRAVAAKVLPAAKPEARVHFEEGLRQLAARARAPTRRRATAFRAATKADPQAVRGLARPGASSRPGWARWDDGGQVAGPGAGLQPASRRTAVAFGDALCRAGRAAADAAELLRKRRRSARRRRATWRLRLLYIQALREAGKTSGRWRRPRPCSLRDSRNARGFNALGLVYSPPEQARPGRDGAAAGAGAGSRQRRRLEQPRPGGAGPGPRPGGLRRLRQGRDPGSELGGGRRSTRRRSCSTAATTSAPARSWRRRPGRAPRIPRCRWRWGWPYAGSSNTTEARTAYERALAAARRLPAGAVQPGRALHGLPARQEQGPRAPHALPEGDRRRGDPRSKEAEARLRELK